MNTHERPELLSAFADGELFGDDRAQVEGHLAGCAECRGTVDALRLTLADLKLLSEPEPSAFESRRLRELLGQRRRRPARLMRAAAAVSGAAAVIAGFVVFAGGQDARQASLDSGAFAAPITALDRSEVNYSEETAHALLFTASPAAAGATADELRTSESGAQAATKEDAVYLHSAPVSDQDAIRRCERINETDGYIAEQYIVARFEGHPVFIMVYRAPPANPDHRELWVVSRDDCSVRFFAQDDL